ncbi:MAG TPA: hypothetical protein VM686_33720, partial [Polyangiaceae bacterium]|nr:hypothetical protein [Polyangiaceae bacterium]
MNSVKPRGSLLLSKLSAYLRLGLFATPLLLAQCGSETPDGPGKPDPATSGSGGAPDGSGGSEAVGMGAAMGQGMAGT